MTQPLILVTNDDGVEAEGLQVLADALAEVGEVHVVAPDVERSASSHSLNVTEPLGATKISEADKTRSYPRASRVHAVNGTPADCVYLAIFEVLPRRPVLVVSGINRGPNLADDIYRSGTVGGAREGAFHGVHSIAISLAARGGHDSSRFSHAAEFAGRIAARVLKDGLPWRSFLNVNVPPGPPEGVRATVQLQPSDGALLDRGPQSRGAGYYWVDEDRDRWESNEPSDLGVVNSGRVSMTLIQTDCTNHRLTGRLQSWARDLEGEAREEQPRAARAEER
jgi:5'-nucleotidase